MSKEKPKGPKKFWPKWFYGPGYVAPAHGEAEPTEFARVFNSQDEVPAGWVDHPSKLNVSGMVTKSVDNKSAGSEPKAAAPKKATKAEAAEEQRLQYLAAAQARFGDVAVPANASLAELIEGLGGEAAALDAVKALNGNGR